MGGGSVTPTTLPALRSAVARVLVARGEAEDAVSVRSVPYDGGRRVGLLAPRYPGHLLAMWAQGATTRDAIAALWPVVVARLDAEWERADDARHEADRAFDRACSALKAAREVGS